jgi:3'-phosphoadenosine 5'-phosphosulfate (PAPS) 3'-phosphatase
MSLDIGYLISVAERAGHAIMAIYEGDASNWDVNHKEDNSPLTRADKEANKIICDALIEWTPHIPIISEENSNESYFVRKVQPCLSNSGIVLSCTCASAASAYAAVRMCILFYQE